MDVKSGSALWHRHPHVRSGSQLTFGERAADVMRNAFGSWAFVGSFLVFMAAWMTLNSLLLGRSAYDRYPYILLNLCLSMMAGLQGALILIAAKRADRVSAEQATAHYAETAKLDQLLTQNNAMTARIDGQTRQLDEIHRHVAALAPEAGRFPPPADDPGQPRTDPDTRPGQPARTTRLTRRKTAMDKNFRGDDKQKGSFRGGPGIVIGRGETGTDPDGPECGVCFATGGGAHGGFCPNAGNPDPGTWTADAPPGYEKPLREARSQHG